MPSADTATIAARLEAARKREQNARATAARLRRELSRASRRVEAQRLCVLGRAWTRLTESDPVFAAAGQRFLDSYVSRDTDRDALRGTRFAVPAALPPDDSDYTEDHRYED